MAPGAGRESVPNRPIVGKRVAIKLYVEKTMKPHQDKMII
jgi:hypothetical protein